MHRMRHVLVVLWSWKHFNQDCFASLAVCVGFDFARGWPHKPLRHECPVAYAPIVPGAC